MASPSQVPARFPSGVSTDNTWGPLAMFGQPNPFMYHTVCDDFDGASTAAGVAGQASDELWTVYTTAASGGTVVPSNALTGGNGEGGQWLFTTGVASTNIESIELAKGSFILPPAASTGLAFASKKLFFMTRINVTTIATTSWTVGLVNPSATPILQPTDGLYLSSTNATNMALYAYSGSTQTWKVAIPAAVLSAYYANATWIDVGFYMDRLQNVYAMVGFPLFGWQPASAWSGTNNVNAAPVPKAAIASYQVQVSGAWTPTTALLTPAIIVAAGSAAAATLYADFILASKER